MQRIICGISIVPQQEQRFNHGMGDVIVILGDLMFRLDIQ
jgi:hypothetical protein